MIICVKNGWNGISYKKSLTCNNFKIDLDVENQHFWLKRIFTKYLVTR